MTKPEIIKTIRGLCLPKNKYIVIMGASLCAHDLRDAGDIDILIDKKLRRQLVQKGFKSEYICREGTCSHRYSKGNIEVFDYFLNVGAYNHHKKILQHIDMISGIPFIALDSLLTIKSKFGRDKDQNDIQLIQRRLCMA